MNAYGAKSVVQEGNHTHDGHIIAGNYNNNTTIYNNNSTPSSLLINLLDKLRSEMDLDNRTTNLIAELKRFQEPHSKKTKSLAVKLEEGKREYLIEFATDSKETFTKKLTKYSLFESAQEIHALVLARIHGIFTTRIRPLILSSANIDQIESSIQAYIIDPIVTELSAEPLRYYDTEVYGMLYFLTGNCHIEWS